MKNVSHGDTQRLTEPIPGWQGRPLRGLRGFHGAVTVHEAGRTQAPLNPLRSDSRVGPSAISTLRGFVTLCENYPWFHFRVIRVIRS